MLSSSEAVFGFMGWLITREEPVTFSSKHNAAVAADLVKEFCEVNNLPEPREDWVKELIHPAEEIKK